MDELKEAIEQLTTSELNQLLDWLFEYRENRLAEDKMRPKMQAATVLQLQNQGAIPRPDALTTLPQEWDIDDIPAWIDPQNKLADMYQLGDIIAYEGRPYRSIFEGLNGEKPTDITRWENLAPDPDDDFGEDEAYDGPLPPESK